MTVYVSIFIIDMYVFASILVFIVKRMGKELFKISQISISNRFFSKLYILNHGGSLVLEVRYVYYNAYCAR